MNKAKLTCPECGHEQNVEIPKNKCLPFYKCDDCQEMIAAKKDSCCVICDYGDVKCPVSIKK